MAAYTTIDNPELYFQSVLWTGNGSNPRTITLDGDENMQPDLVWYKCRSHAVPHILLDSVRGAGNDKELQPDDTTVEGGTSADADGYISAFTSDGFTLTIGSSGDHYTNETGRTFVAWCWKSGGGSTSTNDDGNIDSTITVDTNAGFSILTWSGDSSASATVGHGLGVAPGLIICKEINGTDYWHVFHKSLTANNNIFPNANLAQTAASDGVLASVGSSTFGFYDGGSGVVAVNETGKNNVAWCFAEKQGFSKFGVYDGNGNADGAFVYTGFRPAMVIWKDIDGTNSWRIGDTKRIDAQGGNGQGIYSFPDTNAVEQDATTRACDYLSNGFKIRHNDSSMNGSGVTYVYMAFAEAPFVNSNGVPCNAR